MSRFSTRATQIEAYRAHVNPLRVSGFEELGWTNDFTKGEGSFLEDVDGRRYLDMSMGFGAASLGHNHPAVREALNAALRSTRPGIMPFSIPPLVGLLAEELCAAAAADLQKVYFCNSGTEGIEAALKLAMACTGRRAFVGFRGGYHGLTLGALALMGPQTVWRAPFPHVAALAHEVELGDLDALVRLLAQNEIAGVVLEVVQGVGGGRVWPEGVLTQLAGLCRHHGTLLIIDEVLTGIGRTGAWFAFQESQLRPDIVVTSKGLTGGYMPLGAVLMTDEVFDAVFGTPGGLNVHGSTFSGNLLAMTAGLAVLRTVRDRGLLAHARRAGERLASGLRQLCSETLGVTEIRGRGLLLGVRIRGRGTPNDPSGGVVCCQLLRERGVITTLAGHEQAYLKLTPPLTLSDAEIDLFLAALREAVGEITAATSDHVSA